MIKKLLTLLLILILPSLLFAGETSVDGITGEGHIIADEGVILPQQAELDFVGAGVSVANSPTTGKTVVTIGGVSSVNLADLGDVNTTGATTNDALVYNGSTWTADTLTSMVYPDAGISLSTGSAWGASITNNSANWNTAYGWGNHASAGYLTAEVDGSTTNEIQSPYLTGDTLSLSLTATTVDLSSYYNSLSDLQGAVTNDFHNLGGTDANTTYTAGTGLGLSGTDFSFAPTELGNITFGGGSLASFIHTYDLTGTDVTVTFSSNKITFSGDLEVTGDLYVTDVFVTNIDGDSYISGKLAIGKTTPSYPLDVVGAMVSDAATIDTLTLTNPLTLANGGTGKSTLPAGSVFVTTTADTLTSVISTSGTKILTNTNGVWSLETNTGGTVTYSKSFVITNPTSSADRPLWRTPTAITITGISGLSLGGTNTIISLTECDANGVNPVTIDTLTLTSSNVSDTSIYNSSVDAGDWIGCDVVSVSGAVTYDTVTFDYE
jgi:hypothetical protein